MAKLEMFRGDHAEEEILLPVDSYSVGTLIHFAVKEVLSNQDDDGDALFTVDLTDSDITSTDTEYVTYRLVIDRTKTNAYDFAGKKKKLIAEVQVVNPSTQPTTIGQFDFIIKKDLNRRVA